jgi:hypothetical protein
MPLVADPLLSRTLRLFKLLGKVLGNCIKRALFILVIANNYTNN